MYLVGIINLGGTTGMKRKGERYKETKGEREQLFVLTALW